MIYLKMKAYCFGLFLYLQVKIHVNFLFFSSDEDMESED